MAALLHIGDKVKIVRTKPEAFWGRGGWVDAIRDYFGLEGEVIAVYRNRVEVRTLVSSWWYPRRALRRIENGG